jgi:hypothetical protein
MAPDIADTLDTQVVTPKPLTVNGLVVHRAKAPKLVAGVAALTSSDNFKTTVSLTHFDILYLCMLIVHLILDGWKTKSKPMGS